MSISLANIGPVKNLEIELADGTGGVMLLRGESGTGKSTTLKAINAMLGGGQPLEVNDDAAKGLVEGLGAKVSVGKTTRFTGELETPVVGSRFDLSELVDPVGKTGEVREGRRVRALVGLGGAKADPSLFFGVVGGKEAFDAIVPPEATKTDDLVELAARISRAVHAEAKRFEDMAAVAEKNADVAKGAAAGVDVTLPDNANELQKALIEATTEATTLKNERRTYDGAKAAADEARAKLTEHEKTAIDVTKANLAHHDALAAFKKSSEKVVELRAALKEAEADNDAKGAVVRSAKQFLDAAEQAEKAVKGWREQIEGFSKLPQPSDQSIADADARCGAAREALENGAVVRGAKLKLAEATAQKNAAKDFAKRGEQLRNAARAVDGVLSEQIPAGPLRVVAERLVLETDRSKAEAYDELSDGERVRIALPYVIDFVAANLAAGQSAVITAPQRMWHDLGPADRKWVADYCESKKVWLITAEVTPGELHAERFETVGATTAA